MLPKEFLDHCAKECDLANTGTHRRDLLEDFRDDPTSVENYVYNQLDRWVVEAMRLRVVNGMFPFDSVRHIPEITHHIKEHFAKEIAALPASSVAG